MCEGEKVLPESLVDGFIPNPTDPDFEAFREFINPEDIGFSESQKDARTEVSLEGLGQSFPDPKDLIGEVDKGATFDSQGSLRHYVDDLFSSLTPRESTIIRARTIGGITQAKLAEQMGLSVSTIRRSEKAAWGKLNPRSSTPRS